MNALIKGLLPVVAVALAFPAAAFAQSGDVAYCNALVAKYDQYLNQDSKKRRTAVEPRCQAGRREVQEGRHLRHPGDREGAQGRQVRPAGTRLSVPNAGSVTSHCIGQPTAGR